MLKKILVVDDDPEQCALVCQLVEKKMVEIGAKADCLHTLEAAWERLKVNNISLILLDLCFNGSAGPTLPFIREAAREGFPIIITTGTTIFDSDLLSQCLAAGAKDYWIKGSRFEDLIQKMGVLLERANPQSGSAKVAVQAFRSAPKHFWQFPLSEGFGAKLAVLLTFVTLIGMAWTLMTVSYSGVHDYKTTLEQQGHDKLIDDQAKALAKVTAATVEQHTEQFRSINDSVKEISHQLTGISQTQDEVKRSMSVLHDDVLQGKQERTDIKDTLRELREDARQKGTR